MSFFVEMHGKTVNLSAFYHQLSEKIKKFHEEYMKIGLIINL
ncbi:MAG: hypothetical protein K0Q87_149 [Neobacillus sp.]|jgi:hypothetical protein|nr:hypothetical protein [Neobacillus sp.]